MMKKILLLICLIISLKASAQIATGVPVKHEGTIKINAPLSKHDLYLKVLRWTKITTNFKIRQKDPNGGSVTGIYNYTSLIRVNFSIKGFENTEVVKLKIKEDGNIGYSITDIYNNIYGPIRSGVWQDEGYRKIKRSQMYEMLQNDEHIQNQVLITQMKVFFNHK